MRSDPDRRDSLRAGIFGIVLVTCVVLVSFGYTKLPFWPTGQRYIAYFAHAGGIVTGNPVQIYGYTVGQVDTVELDIASQAAKVGFTVDRKIRVGDQSLVAIKTDTVLGQRSVEVSPAARDRSPPSRWPAPALPTRSTTHCKTWDTTSENSINPSSSKHCRP